MEPDHLGGSARKVTTTSKEKKNSSFKNSREKYVRGAPTGWVCLDTYILYIHSGTGNPKSGSSVLPLQKQLPVKKRKPFVMVEGSTRFIFFFFYLLFIYSSRKGNMSKSEKKRLKCAFIMAGFVLFTIIMILDLSFNE